MKKTNLYIFSPEPPVPDTQLFLTPQKKSNSHENRFSATAPDSSKDADMQKINNTI